MKRQASRELAVRLCYALGENPRSVTEVLEETFDEEYYASLPEEDELYAAVPDERERDYISRVVRGVSLHGPELDGYIEKYAVGWKFGRISRTAVATLRVAMYEVMYMPEIPPRVALNEAVELAKKYETPETVSFMNGILGSFSRVEIQSDEILPKPEPPQELEKLELELEAIERELELLELETEDEPPTDELSESADVTDGDDANG
jgi:N utilization substance protein B